jgi:NAD(P)-dependent dehydrogenase (short-subunit alcohol dehydrogenase family)
MSNRKLEGQAAIITGGSRGLGQAIAYAFAEEGADVGVIGRDQSALDATVAGVEKRGCKALSVVADLRDVRQIPGVLDQIEEGLGECTILVNSAGVQGDRPALEVTEELYDEVVDTNLKSLFFCCQEVGRRMIDRGGGKIINLGSTFSLVGRENFSVYCATKGGVLQLTKVLAIEWAKHGVNVNAIGPTATLTDMVKPLFENAEFKATFMPMVPAGHLPEPEDIGRAAVFLAGPDSRMIHGHLLMVDCGYTIN